MHRATSCLQVIPGKAKVVHHMFSMFFTVTQTSESWTTVLNSPRLQATIRSLL